MQNIQSDFLALKPLDQVSAVFGVGVPIAGGLFGYWKFVTRKLRLKSEELHKLQKLSENRFQQINKLQEELDQRDDALRALEAQLPDNWLQQAVEEREEGNEERAISCLRTRFESIREPLSDCCLDLASHHFTLAADYGERHIGEAERLARIAMLLCPSNEDTRLFLAEILALEAGQNYASSNYQAYETLWEEACDFLEIDNRPDIIDTLRNHARQYDEQGYYRLAERLYCRVLQMCNRHFGPDPTKTLMARSLYANSMYAAGHNREALSLQMALLPDVERVLGKDHPDTLRTQEQIAFLQSSGD